MPDAAASAPTDIFTTLPHETIESATTSVALSFREAIDIIDGRDANRERYRRVRQAIECHIAESRDAETIGVGYYYLIRSHLLEQTFRETMQLRELYAKMHVAFSQAEQSYREAFKKSTGGQRVILRQQFSAFYQLVNGYLKALELIYAEHGFTHAEERTHEDRMRFRRRSEHHDGHYLKNIWHFFMEHTNNYGHSFGRWGVTVAIFLIMFALIYDILDHAVTGGALRNVDPGKSFFEYLYFSTVVLTTIGFGDIVPIGIARVAAGIEGLLGYIMLGIFLTLLQKRL